MLAKSLFFAMRMHRVPRLLLFGSGLLAAGASFAQQFGGNPPTLKWNQINTDTARIIFPAGLDSQASRAANIVHYLAAQRPFSLGNQLKKINIVLQNQTTIPNGYVQLGPFRSEFFLTPDLNNFSQGSIAWGDQLALHEYRHVQQFNNFNNGLSRVMKTLFGEEGFALAINASVPDWFYEGDAVYQETVLTRQGRGRLPNFLNAFPSLWQAGKKYSWMKIRNGSWKDYVPNHYNLGYLLVHYGREKYGPDFWTKVTTDASAFKGLFYPFQRAVKKHTGISYKDFREQAFEQNRKSMDSARTGHSALLPVNKRYVTHYQFPYQVGTDSLLYLKTTYRHRPAFMLRDATGEHRVRVRDISLDEQFSYRNGKIVYAAYEADPRWGWRDYSVIKLLDLQTGQQRRLTKQSKYFTPDISGDGTLVAAVQADEKGRSGIHIIDVATGEIRKTIQSHDINLFTDPKFIDGQSLVTAVRLADGKMALARADIASGNTMRLTPPSFNVLGYPCVSNGIIYFNASFGGNDDVFALRLSDSKIFRVSNGPLGNYYPNAANGRISWSAFTAEGYQLQQVEENRTNWTEVSTAVAEQLSVASPVSHAGTAEQNFLYNMPQRSFATEKYRKGTKLLNFHSWRPYYEDPIFTFSLYGQNVLNTLETEIYYLYNENEKTSAVGFGTVYGAAFPYLNMGTELTFNREAVTGNKLRRWNQLDSRIGFSIPLSWVSGQSFRNFNIGSSYVLRNDFNRGFFKDSMGNTSFSYLQHFISWSQQVQQATQHIYPRFAAALSATYRHAISRYEGNQFISSGSLYIPGLASVHNFIVSGSFQQRDTLGQITFGNRFAYSRGYTGRYFSRMWRVSGNYHLPLFYPDWGLASILYLQRVRANFFYDFTKVYSRDKKTTRNQRSVGGEVFIDTKWWNQYPLTFGFRVSHLLDADQFDGWKGTLFEFIMPVSIIPR